MVAVAQEQWARPFEPELRVDTHHAVVVDEPGP